jgi:hypothetical protein
MRHADKQDRNYILITRQKIMINAIDRMEKLIAATGR